MRSCPEIRTLAANINVAMVLGSIPASSNLKDLRGAR
jgi:hypothetical protein